ncbi:hypothetical protein [Fodinibius sediminis]|uniref:Uncharacterized protein n=1 Tax=Fodinibius sediminis TaxID=1214077 RepID=A0A521EY78_9BACT|nr:hypothetical protein [Fodinibius sediminis]SMO88982.1 hypothetical protein SAMN06265218_12042 [Fodinibius sediminis]
MEANTSNHDNGSSSSTKRLVKILVIIGIGIPVLVELLTLFNLVNVQMFEDEENARQPASEAVADVSAVAEGDTLFSDQLYPVRIKEMRVSVSAQQWRFELGLEAMDDVTADQLEIEMDSIRLDSDRVLMGQQVAWTEVQRRPVSVRGEWTLQNGDIPAALYIGLRYFAGTDSSRHLQREIPLSTIPVRYTRQ